MRSAGRLLSILVAGAVLAGCSEVQSALAPAGTDAARVLVLTLILTIGAAVVLFLVAAGLAIAIAGGGRARALLADHRIIWIGGIVFPSVTLSLLLGYGLWLMRTSISEARSEPHLRIEVSGEQWWWRVTYVLPNGQRLQEANEIRMPVGRDVEFVLTSADVIHAFWVPALGGKMDMVPGRSNRLRLTASRAGTYRGQCAEYCGGAHALMAKDVVVMERPAFETWLAAPAPSAPANEAEARGASLFIAAGCGACHTVRGTPATGAIGPDLTRMGGRLSIAAATLPNTPANLARFIADGQHVKPGNLMPPFNALSPAERAAIAAYLTSLK
jgi:cytochrome c oxidase subunit 2